MRYLLGFLMVLAMLRAFGDPRPARKVVNLLIPSFADCDDGKTLVIPIRRVQNLIVIEAQIDTIVGNFILDTGSQGVVLNSTYFRYGQTVSDKVSANAAGTTDVIVQTRVKSLAIKDLYFENMIADLNDLGHIENRRGLKILGLLGVSLFMSFEMVIDLYRGELYLRKPENPMSFQDNEHVIRTAPILAVPFRLSENIITVDVTVGGKILNFCLDTGAETNAISNLLSKKLLRQFRVSKRILMLGTGGSQSEVLLGTLNEFTIGTKSFKNMNAAITRLDDLGRAYGQSIDGILGNNFLVKGIVSINFVTKELFMYSFDVSRR